MKIYTNSFENSGRIPVKFTCDGENSNPEIYIEDAPKEAKSLVLIVEDPDSPNGNWIHWLVWNIDPKIKIIKENSVPAGVTIGLNDFKNREYGGPCPFKGEHRYFFKIFAVDKLLDLPSASRKEDLERAMTGSILDKSEFMGRYSRV
ncbi:MAG: YbhB/YbcL family Raf kinase inhibitor-like protein [Minisyncoccota bacterium]